MNRRQNHAPLKGMNFRQYLALKEGNVERELAVDAGKGAWEGGSGVSDAIQGGASMLAGNLLGGAWGVIKGAIDAFSGFSKMGTSGSLLLKAMNHKKVLAEQLKSVPEGAKVIEVIYDIDDSVKDLFSPALIRETLADFVSHLGSSSSLEEKTFAAAMERAAAKVYGSAQNSAGKARQTIAAKLQSVAPPAVQQQVNQVMQHAGSPEPEESGPASLLQKYKNFIDPNDYWDQRMIEALKKPNSQELNWFYEDALRKRAEQFGKKGRLPREGDAAYTHYRGVVVGKLVNVSLSGGRVMAKIVTDENVGAYNRANKGTLHFVQNHNDYYAVGVGYDGEWTWDTSKNMWFAPADSD